MSDPKWIETKKEVEYNERGEAIPKKVTLELDRLSRKDRLDLILKYLGLLGVIGVLLVPIISYQATFRSVFAKRDADLELKRAQYQVDLYLDAVSTARTLQSVSELSSDYNLALVKFNEEIYPKVRLMCNDSIWLPLWEYCHTKFTQKNLALSVSIIDSVLSLAIPKELPIKRAHQMGSDLQSILHSLRNRLPSDTEHDSLNFKTLLACDTIEIVMNEMERHIGPRDTITFDLMEQHALNIKLSFVYQTVEDYQRYSGSKFRLMVQRMYNANPLFLHHK